MKVPPYFISGCTCGTFGKLRPRSSFNIPDEKCIMCLKVCYGSHSIVIYSDYILIIGEGEDSCMLHIGAERENI